MPKEKLKEKIGDTSGTAILREDDPNHSNEVIVGKHGKTIEKSDDDLSPKCNVVNPEKNEDGSCTITEKSHSS